MTEFQKLKKECREKNFLKYRKKFFENVSVTERILRKLKIWLKIR